MSRNPKKEDWLKEKWRPMMGWMYMATCITDFIIFPVLWSILQAIQGGQVTSQWNPLTLQGAGLFHLAMGAVLGVAAWSRGQEKILGVASSTPIMTYNYSQSYPYNTRPDVTQEKTFISKQGKPGPIIEEPEI
jgi:uncharacterized membrane protein YdfJ with MMPL/SSD domain